MSEPKLRKLAVLGSKAVGKTAITIQFAENHFNDTYYATIENTFTKNVKVGNEEILAEIMDTPGLDEYSMLSQRHVVNMHGFILVYSVTSKKSFEMLRVVREKVLGFLGSDSAPMILVGNKTDLPQRQRQVQTTELRGLAAEWQCSAVECSAKQNISIEPVFHQILEEIERSQNQENLNGSKCVIM